MEDAIYRTSSQHMLWSFTPESLSDVRKATNAGAAAQVREAIQRAREKKTSGLVNEGGQKNGVESDVSTPIGEPSGPEGITGEEREIECLTAEEELKLVRYYCRKIMEFATVFEFPTNVKVSFHHSE